MELCVFIYAKILLYFKIYYWFIIGLQSLYLGSHTFKKRLCQSLRSFSP